MSALMDKIQSTSKGVFFLIGVGLGGSYYYSNMSSLEAIDAQIKVQKEALQKNEDEVKEAQRVANDKSKFEEEVNKVSDQLKAALQYLPNKFNEQELLTKITNEARSAGVNPTSIAPKKPEKKDFYEEVLMEVEMEGSYTQLVLFLSYVSKIPRIINIRGLELQLKKMEEETPILRMKGTLVGYRYLENAAADAAAKTAAGPGGAAQPPKGGAK